MKKYLIIWMALVATVFISCDADPLEHEVLNTYDGVAVGLNETFAQVSVPTTGITETFPVVITNSSTETRTFGLEYVGDAPTGGGVSLGTITVPANSLDGTASVNFDFGAINLGDGETDTFSIRATSDSTDIFGTILEIEYFKQVVCNDATFTINTDTFAEETGFFITDDATGNVVYTMPALSRGVQTYTEDIFLADGCYTATITDSYGDGQVDQNNTGDYTITCSILTFASGGGAFGASQTRQFCVNQ
ncbi:hypothetical protein LX97_00366 [Nonlabens dokdonensis]|uniref:Secreted protein n=2 Tax=Nonlabens dokdonensis TaxID=328515 RepID=L7W9X0_NONDD|nr:hypothetical protein [Nonlabens dokdonensis]AGC75678.1 secreted protein [Nonlabens dokdonensis DSW-6]PZX43366.1 hypothetical protein LX97_00366 [Nonlabens dokdonensis]